ncbi:MAG: Wzz/FepE/Etk N-terminal domain-containing protein [Sulfuricaulis sp.]|nr:Wzz/FepE/Etk N-terminal domain-containing protein [Sulfuricaulis sp.]
MTKTDSSNPPLSTVGGSTQRLSDDDVSLLKLWSTLIRRKTLILAIFLISPIMAGLFIFFTPPVYESRAVLQIGQMRADRAIESPAVLTKRVMVQDDMDREKTEIGRVRPFIHTAFLEKDTNLISILARGPTPDAAQEYLAQVVAKVMHDHQELFDLARKEQQQSLNLLQMHGQRLNQAIAANEKELSTLTRQPASADAITAYGPNLLRSILLPEKSKLFEQHRLVEQQQMDLRMAASALRFKPTTLIKAPTLTADPIKPRPLPYFAFAMGIGLMLGIFSALVVEFISKARRLASS